MNENTRDQMIQAVTRMLEFVNRYGNRHGTPAVELADDGSVEMVPNSRPHSRWCVVSVSDVSELAGADWKDELDMDDEEAVSARLASEAAWWVDEYGQGELDEARARVAAE